MNESPDRIPKRPGSWPLFVSGVVCTCLGSAVLFGWYTHNIFLVRFSEQFPAMAYNTALAYLLSGLAFICLCLGRLRWATAFAAVVATGASLILVQHATGIDLGIDEALFRSWLRIVPTPGRMSILTTFCFLLSSAAALLVARGQANQITLIMISLAIGSIGLLPFIAYATGGDAAYPWRGTARMALHTATGFTAISLGLGIHALRLGRDGGLSRLPLVAGVVVILLSEFVWYNMLVDVRNRHQEDIRASCGELARVLQLENELIVESMRRLARRSRQAMARGRLAEWEADAQSYLSGIPALAELAVVTSAGQLVWSSAGSSGLRPHSHFSPERRSQLLELADKRVVMTAMPIDSGRILLAMFEVEGLVERVMLQSKLSSHSIEIRVNGKAAFERRHLSSYANYVEGEGEAEAAGAHWRVIARTPMSQTHFREIALVDWVLISGILAGLLSFGIHYVIVTRHHSKTIESANLELHHTIARLILTQSHLRESLVENKALFKEVHHRVKNNLQVISSLLRLQESQLEDAVSRQALQDSVNRVQSMALLHEQLYKSVNLSSVDLAEYLSRLVKHLAAACSLKISVDVEISPGIAIGAEQAIPCGLIVNELVSNSLKHAFPTGNGSVRVTGTQHQETITLRIQDSGIGLPSDFQLGGRRTLGMQLVEQLSSQLDAQFTYGNSSGAFFELSFRSPEMAERWATAQTVDL